MKALDTFFTRSGNHDLFFYTKGVTRSDLQIEALQAMPVIVQRYADEKLDLRVSVIGETCLSVAILSHGAPVDGDWRLHKNDVEYQIHDLPADVTARCVDLLKVLGLSFGAIDLLLIDGEYVFLEINPTGEWAWLVDTIGFPLPRLIVDALCVHN